MLTTISILVNMFFIAAITGLYFLIIKPCQDEKNAIKQKAAEDSQAKRKADEIIGRHPTLSRHYTDESFRDTELGY